MTTTKHLTDEDALAIFETGEDFELTRAEYTPLGRILLAREARERADALLADAVAAGREAGLTWEQVGTGLGITKEGARKRYASPAARVKQLAAHKAEESWTERAIGALTEEERDNILAQNPELGERAEAAGASTTTRWISGNLGMPPRSGRSTGKDSLPEE